MTQRNVMIIYYYYITKFAIDMPCEIPECLLQFYEALPCEEKGLLQKPEKRKVGILLAQLNFDAIT